MPTNISQKISQMTLKQKIGQLLIFGWDGANEEQNTTVSEHARILVEEFEVGGIVLLPRNVASPERMARTMNELQEKSRIPLFIVVDQEGGMVARFKDPFVVFPSNMSLGATGNMDYAYKAARATAEQLRAVGVNFNFAPVVDVNNNPLNPIIGTRSYGDNPGIVSRFARAAIRGYHDGGVLTSVKHFPGHGDTSVDSHLALPTVDFPRKRIEQVELPPFKAAIEAGVASIMTTHILFPAFDTELPSTLSYPILTKLLRDELGYDGVIITDCLEMKGVADKWGTANAALGCIKAGADCPLICHTLSTQREAVEGIIRAVETGEVSMERLDESVHRVLELKERFGILAGVTPVDPNAAEAIVSSEEKKALALEIARKAVTVVKDEAGLIPAHLNSEDKVVTISMHPSLQQFTDYLKQIHPNTEAIAPNAAELASATPVIVPRDAKLVITATCPSEPWTAGLDVEAQTKMVNYLLELGLPIVIVALRDPYDIRWFPRAKTYLALYGYRSKESLRAAAEVILGRCTPSGKLPVSLDN